MNYSIIKLCCFMKKNPMLLHFILFYFILFSANHTNFSVSLSLLLRPVIKFFNPHSFWSLAIHSQPPFFIASIIRLDLSPQYLILLFSQTKEPIKNQQTRKKHVSFRLVLRGSCISWFMAKRSQDSFLGS